VHRINDDFEKQGGIVMRSQRFRVFGLLGWLLFSVAADAVEPPAAPTSIAIVGVNVVPMTGELVLERQTVLVSGNVITALGKEEQVSAPRGALTIDGRGKYLMPGLAEMHAHVPSGEQSRAYRDEVLFLYVANGVTLARGMLGDPEHLTLRTQLAAHEILGPRLYTSGPSLNGKSVNDAEQGAAMVRAQKQAGYDFIKLHPGLTRDSFLAIARTAHEVAMPFGGHVSQDVGLRVALENHQATVDHLDGYVLAVSSAAEDPTAHPDNAGLAMKFEPSRMIGVIERTRAAGTWVVPTQSLSENMIGRETPEALDARPEMRYVSPQRRTQYRTSKQATLDIKGLTPELSNKFLDLRRQIIRELSDAGAGLLLGSDAPQLFNVPGFSAHRELQSMVAAGLAPYQALRMGTAAPAEFLRESGKFGIVAVGASADLVLLDANPLADIANTRKIRGVMVRGRWLDRTFIDRGLANVAETVSQH
jgi:imidazolonepropionase-like amidohydrolase